MRRFLKQRTRVLVICADPQVRSTLVALLTGFEFYVDYVDNIAAALAKFKAYRHPVVLLDETLIDGSPRRLVDLFRLVQNDCLIMAIAKQGGNHEHLFSIEQGLFDVLELPIEAKSLQFRIRRLLSHHQVTSSLNFMRIMALVAVLFLPLLVLLVRYQP